MKKHFIPISRLLLIGIVTTTTVTVTSCRDDLDDLKSTSAGNTQTADALESGYNVITASYSQLFTTRVPISTNEVTITNVNSKFKYPVVQEGGQYYIEPSFSGEMTDNETDVMKIETKDGKKHKSILVTLTGEKCSMLSRGAGGGSTTEEVDTLTAKGKVLYNLTCGFTPGIVAPEAKAPSQVFNSNLITQLNNETKGSDNLLNIENAFHQDYFFEKATDHNESVKKSSWAAGVNLAIPVKGWLLGADCSYERNSTEKYESDSETANYGWKIRVARGHLNVNALADNLDKKNKTELKGTLDNTVAELTNKIIAKGGETDRAAVEKSVRLALALQPIMNSSLVNLLDNPSSSSYKLYSNDDLRSIVDNYGMYVSTDCQMGGMARQTLTKKTDGSNISLEQAVKLTLQANSCKSGAEVDTTTIKEEGHKVVTSILRDHPAPKIKVTLGCKWSSENVKNTMKLRTETHIWGGNGVLDINKWDLNATKPSEWVCISYAFGSKDGFGELKDVSSGKGKDGEIANASNIIPLWKLCLDPDRREALRKLCVPDESNKIPYFNYTKAKNKSLVIADIRFKAYDGKNISEKDVQPFYDYDNRYGNRQMHLYIPMRQNVNGIGEAGSILNLSNKNVIGCDEDHITHSLIPFVAYEFIDPNDVGSDFTGITSVRIGDTTYDYETKLQPWTFIAVTGSSHVDPEGSQHLIVRYADKSTKFDKRIKGVGFCYSNEDLNGDKRCKVFAASIGTDVEPSNHDATWKDFENHWTGNSRVVDIRCEDNFLNTKWGFFKCSYDPKYHIQPCYTFEKITRSNDQIDTEMKKAAN